MLYLQNMSLAPSEEPKPTIFWKMSRPHHIAKWAVITGIIILALDISIIGAFSFIRLPVTHVDAVMILGAKVGTPALTERTLLGLKYYQEGKTDTIVLSGGRGSGESISEAQAMQEVLEHRIARIGSASPTVILESKSINTFQNIHNSNALIPNAKSVVIVTDIFHLARSVALAKRDGFREVYWDAPIPSYYPPWDLAYYYLREMVGMLVYVPKFITN